MGVLRDNEGRMLEPGHWLSEWQHALSQYRIRIAQR
jgi:mannose/cellobiose epimerase-like protein (N-acyl-D-glucosamine 2-epimerase family)